MRQSLPQHCQPNSRATFIRLLLLVQVCWLAGLTSLHAQTIRYVTEEGTGTGNGSWSNASGNLQDMINASDPGDQVWVTAGTYKPGDQRYHSFSLKKGVAVYGGFSGNEMSLAERALTYPSSTTLSGELGDPSDPADNSYHVVVCYSPDKLITLDGFVISGGNANVNGDDDMGGGMLIYGDCESVKPKIQNCYFTNNRANSGSALCALGNVDLILINCVFFNNLPNGDTSGETFTTTGNVAMVNCTLAGNWSKSGNVIRNGEHLTLTNCILWNNKPIGGGADGPDITGEGIRFFVSATQTINQDNLSGTGNLTTNPNFVNESTGDLRLTACSGAINTGNLDSYTAVGGPDKDIAGQARVFGDYIDIGAFEFQRSSVTAPTLALQAGTTLPILQNTPFVTVVITGCDGGTVHWKGSNATSGTGNVISVPTATIATLFYSATCTVGSCTSSPGSATVVVHSPTETGSFDGFVYGADCATFRGWAWDRNKINTVQSVQILDGPTVLATISANEFRQDLKDAGKGNGIHAFRWSITDELKDGQVHYLSARVANSGFILKDSPKALICQGGTTAPPNKQPIAPTMTPLTAQQGVAFTTILPSFTDPEGSTLSYGLVTLPTGLTFASATRQISGTPTASGLFVLTYSATDDKGATNSVSFNLTINPAATTPVTGSFEGYLDKVECGTIRGWVWDRNKPNTPLTVEFYTGGTVWGSVVANIFRDDLKNAGKGNGAHAYSFTVPSELKDGNIHLIRARVSGSTYDLKDSGKPLTCNSPVRLSAESSEGFQVTVLGNPVSDKIEVEVRGAEGKPLRFQLTDASGRLISQHQIEVAKPVERQTFSVSQQPAGLLLLRVNSGLRSVTLKVLKQ